MVRAVACVWAAIMATGLNIAGAETPPTLADLEKTLSERWAKLDGFTADMQVDMNVSKAGIAVKSTMTGPITFKRIEENRSAYRSQLSGKVSVGPFGLITVNARVLAVSDGETLYTETRTGNEIQVVKTRPEQKDDAPGGGESKLSAASKKYTLRVLPNARLGDAPVYVIEGRPKPGAAEELPGLDRVLLYFDQATGIQRRISALDVNGKSITEIRFSKITPNPDVDASFFKYEIPEGATVIDKTQTEN